MPAYANTFPEAISSKESDYLYTQTSGIVNAGLGLFSSIAIYKNEIVGGVKPVNYTYWIEKSPKSPEK